MLFTEPCLLPMKVASMDKEKARRLVRTAIAQGKLIRPEVCEKCGKAPGKAIDGRPKIHAHHHDYSKPLDVEWLCARCHRYETPFPEVVGGVSFGDNNGMRKHPGLSQGSKNGWAKLDEAKVSQIKSRPNEPAKILAEEFGVKPVTIYDIREGKRWKHVSAAQKPEGGE